MVGGVGRRIVGRAMYRTLLKLLIYELVEKIVRFEGLLNELEQTAETVSPAFIHGVRRKLDALKRQILSEKALCSLLFSEKAPKEKEILAKLDQLVFEPYRAICDLSQLLSLCAPGAMVPETALFLKDVLGDPFAQERSQQVVLFHPEGQPPSAHTLQLDGLLLEPLSVLNKLNPLGWVGLVQAVVAHLYDHAAPLQTLKSQIKGPVAKDEHLRPLVTHTLSLRLMGPAYYFYAVTEALLRKDTRFLTTLEEALFYGVNHLNFTDKSLVILHEATEKSRDLFGEPESGITISEDQVAQLLRTVEKVVPERAAFGEKSFQRAVALQDRLGQEVLLSSMNLYPVAEVHSTLSARQAETRGPGDKFPIYELLGMVSETPNTPREIVNAGWIHKLDRGPVWLYNTLNSTGLEGFERLSELVSRQDHLLIKSIETSEVHRVLLCGL